jgi:uncharacterized protein (TIGR00369 family)
MSEITGDHVLAELGMREVPATTGSFAMEMAVGPRLTNNRGGLQGGLLATMVDIVAGIAALDGLPEGHSLATADMHLHFLSAVTVGPAHAEARVIRRGKRTAVVQVEVHDRGRDVLSAISTLSFAVIELRPDQVDTRRFRGDGH